MRFPDCNTSVRVEMEKGGGTVFPQGEESLKGLSHRTHLSNRRGDADQGLQEEEGGGRWMWKGRE